MSVAREKPREEYLPLSTGGICLNQCFSWTASHRRVNLEQVLQSYGNSIYNKIYPCKSLRQRRH